jgi:hypothetical protein
MRLTRAWIVQRAVEMDVVARQRNADNTGIAAAVVEALGETARMRGAEKNGRLDMDKRNTAIASCANPWTLR